MSAGIKVSDRLSKAEAVVNAANLDDGTPVYVKALLNCFTFIISELRELNKKLMKAGEVESNLELQKRVTDALKKNNDRLSNTISKLTVKVDQMDQLQWIK